MARSHLYGLPLEFGGVRFWDVPGDTAVVYYGRASAQLGAAAAGFTSAFFHETPGNGAFFSTYQLNGYGDAGDVPIVGRVLALGAGVRCATGDAELTAWVRAIVDVQLLDENGNDAGLPVIPITGHQWASGNLPMMQGAQLEVLQGGGPRLLPLSNPRELFPRHFQLRARFEHLAGGTLAVDTHVEFLCAVALFPKPTPPE